jgi:putative transposase
MSWKTHALQSTSVPLHVYNRGVNSDVIFRGEPDYAYWMGLMAEALPRFEVDILLYALMPNHYHIGLSHHKPYEVSWFLREVCGKYAKFFNRKYQRHGALFAGRFHPKVVFDDAGLLRLSHYIHMNPVSAGLVANPTDWRYSSCPAYLESGENELLNVETVLNLVGGVDGYRTFLADYDPGDSLSIFRFLKNGGKMT